jgi:phage shock protein A
MEAAERHTRELEARADAIDELVADGIVARPGESSDDLEARRFDRELGLDVPQGTEVEGEGRGPQQVQG